MNGYDVKKVMDQVHISEEMQEDIIMNVQNRIENRNKNTREWNWRRMVAAAAAFILAAGLISFPVRAFVTSVVKERMESIPKEEVQEINDMVQSKPTEADTFSREYYESEKERNKELWQAYKDGKFPENAIAQVDNEEDAPEGTLYYVKATGVFNLPAQEMTDEELLEIIDFQHKMSYAVEQSLNGKTPEQIAEEDLARELAERAMLEEKVKAAGGISKEEAIEIAKKAIEADIGEMAKELKLLIDRPEAKANGWEVGLLDITDADEYKGDIAYVVQFDKWDEMMEPEDFLHYVCYVNAIDGSISGAYSISGDNFDYDDIVWYEH
ncbi:MAG: hypothetical protein K2K46_05915 [Lachnospiraceae bacterium]|nr:hypothetical protein [Lachnospiraceae bacterium]